MIKYLKHLSLLSISCCINKLFRILFSSLQRYTILKTETGVLSLMIKEIFAKVCALCNK